MSWTPTDEQALVKKIAHVLAQGYGTSGNKKVLDMVAVGPMIAAQALRDAAHMLDTSWAGIRQKASPGWLRNQADIIEKEAGQ